nr:family 10 glycosylhydrolase [Acidobacteriota bacterium]
RPGITISAAVLPDPLAARNVKLQDWPAWTAGGLVDAICPMAYAEDRATFSAQIAAVRDAAGPVPVWTGIGAYRLTAAETAARIREARRAGAAGVLLFSYDSVITGRSGARYLTDVGRAVFPVLPPKP